MTLRSNKQNMQWEHDIVSFPGPHNFKVCDFLSSLNKIIFTSTRIMRMYVVINFLLYFCFTFKVIENDSVQELIHIHTCNLFSQRLPVVISDHY